MEFKSSVWSSHIAQLRAPSISCNTSWTAQHRDQTLCFSARDWFFSSAATKGWAWCKHDAELVEGAATVRKQASGRAWMLGIAGMDSLHNITCRQCVTLSEHPQLKGWQPRFKPTEAKSLVCSSHIAQLRAQSVYCNNSWRPQLQTKPFASLHEAGFLLQLQRIWAGGACCGSQGEWMLGIPKRNGGNGLLRQTCC